jgi:hypothetical protein
MDNCFNLQDIANWQLKSSQSKVLLPVIQRGFVWKPKQVEDLWDSILRGYPIGSFLFSQAGEKFYLLDGQQRATSIFLGHFNPYNPSNETKAWSIKRQLPVVWIDLNPASKPTTNKYLVRLTTDSHPWGYQAVNNGVKLSEADRREALKLFRKHPDNAERGYTTFANTTVFPYQADYPLPLCFFLESESADSIIDMVERYLPDYFLTKSKKYEGKKAFMNLLKKDLYDRLSELLQLVQQQARDYQVVSTVINADVLKEDEDGENENPTIFVRLNSAGTVLSGDDLNYSIYKAVFPDAKSLIEEIALDFISPPQTFSLILRMVTASIANNSYTSRLSVTDFQKKIKSPEFKDRLQSLVGSEAIKSVFEESIHILLCKDTLSGGGMPPILVKQFVKKYQDLYLFLLYWLYLHKNVNIQDKKQVAAKLFTLGWFGFDDTKWLWNENIGDKDFWHKPLDKLLFSSEKSKIKFLLNPDTVRRYYEQKDISDNRPNSGTTDIENEMYDYYKNNIRLNAEISEFEQAFNHFIGALKQNRNLVFFSQRDYVNTAFSDYNQMDNLHDTNTPWDLDHIYPDSWVYQQKHVPPIVRHWINTNGNFRAISLEQNRSESNHVSPKDRLSDSTIRTYSFVQDADWAYWQQLNGRIYPQDKDKTIAYFKAVTGRMIAMYEKFLNDFNLSSLVKYNSNSNLLQD